MGIKGQKKRTIGIAAMLGIAAAAASLTQPQAYYIPSHHGLKAFNGPSLAGFELENRGPLNLVLWDTTTFKIAKRLRDVSRDIHSAALSGDGKRWLAGRGYGGVSWVGPTPGDYAVELRSLETGKVEKQFDGARNSVMRVWFGPGEKLVFAATELADLHVWNLETGKHLFKVRHRAVAVSADGRRIGAATPEGASVWNAEGLLLQEIKGDFASIGISPDGQTLVLNDRTRKTSLVKVRDGKTTLAPFEAVSATFVAGASSLFAQTKQPIPSSGRDPHEGPRAIQFAIFDAATGARRAEFNFSGGLHHPVVISPDRTRAIVHAVPAIDGATSTITLIDLAQAKVVARIPYDVNQALIAFSSDSKTFCLSAPSTTTIVDALTGKIIKQGELE